MAKKLSKTIGKGKKLVSIPIYYRVKEGPYGNLQFQILSMEDGKKAIEQKDVTVEVLNTKWRHYGWQMSNLILQTSLSYNPQSGQNEIDWSKYQDSLFKQCMLEWDLTDENDQPIAVSPEALDDLPPEIAKALIRSYDKSNTIDPEEQKN